MVQKLWESKIVKTKTSSIQDQSETSIQGLEEKFIELRSRVKDQMLGMFDTVQELELQVSQMKDPLMFELQNSQKEVDNLSRELDWSWRMHW